MYCDCIYKYVLNSSIKISILSFLNASPLPSTHACWITTPMPKTRRQTAADHERSNPIVPVPAPRGCRCGRGQAAQVSQPSVRGSGQGRGREVRRGQPSQSTTARAGNGCDPVQDPQPDIETAPDASVANVSISMDRLLEVVRAEIRAAHQHTTLRKVRRLAKYICRPILVVDTDVKA